MGNESTKGAGLNPSGIRAAKSLEVQSASITLMAMYDPRFPSLLLGSSKQSPLPGEFSDRLIKGEPGNEAFPKLRQLVLDVGDWPLISRCSVRFCSGAHAWTRFPVSPDRF